MPRTFSLQSEGYHPFGELIGLAFATVERGRSQCSLTVRESLLNPHQVLHGGVIYSMADTGMGGALYSALDPDESCATIEIKIVYFAPVTAGSLTCDSTVLHRARNFAILESIVTQGERLIARALGTFAVWQSRRD